MHIVFVTVELSTGNNMAGGLASFTENIVRVFARNGHRVTIILSTPKETEVVFDEGIEVLNSYIPKKSWDRMDRMARVLTYFDKKYMRELRQVLFNVYRSWDVNKIIKEVCSKKKVDLVHYCSLESLALLADKKIPHVVRLSSLRHLCRGANYPEGQYGYKEIPLLLTEKLYNYVLSKQEYIISPSCLLADVVKKYINPRVTVLESPFMFDAVDWDYRVYNEQLRGKKYILYFGTLKYLKGTNTIARLAKAFLQQNPDMYLVLAGKSEEMRDLQGKLIKAQEWVLQCAEECCDRVVCTGALFKEELYPIIEGAELCLFPSRIENLSNACIEAMALGKIVVATNGASYEQLIEDKENGFLCERDNSDSFLQGIMEALNLTPDEKLAMSAKAKESVERLKPEAVYENFLHYYEEVIRNWR